jgi:hypothetical protein
MHDLIPLPHSCALTTALAAELDSAADYAAASLSESTRRAYAEDAVMWRRAADLSCHAAAPEAAQCRRIAPASFRSAASVAEHGTRQGRLDRTYPALHHGENSHAVRLGRLAMAVHIAAVGDSTSAEVHPMNEQELRFTLGALIDLIGSAVLVDGGEDIDGEAALQTLEAVGLVRVHPEEGLVLSDFASQCLAEFQQEMLKRAARGP